LLAKEFAPKVPPKSFIDLKDKLLKGEE